MGEDVAGGVLWYVVRNAPTFLAMFFLMLLAVRGRLRFSLGVTVGMALGIVAAVSLACGIGVAVFAGEEGVWATVPVLAVSLLSLAALTKLPWGKRLFVFFSAATAAAIAILAYDVLLRTVALEWSFGARRVLDAVVCSAGPLVLAPLFARTIRWGVEQVDDPALWRRLAAVPAGFFVAANALYMFAYAVEFLSSGSDALYALAVGVLAFLMVASYLMLFSALRTVMENARLREAAQLEELQHERYRSLRRTLRDTAKARHDFRHQLLVIRSFADEDDVQGLRAYLDEQGAGQAQREPGAYALNFALDAVAASLRRRRVAGLRAARAPAAARGRFLHGDGEPAGERRGSLRAYGARGRRSGRARVDSAGRGAPALRGCRSADRGQRRAGFRAQQLHAVRRPRAGRRSAGRRAVERRALG